MTVAKAAKPASRVTKGSSIKRRRNFVGTFYLEKRFWSSDTGVAGRPGRLLFRISAQKPIAEKVEDAEYDQKRNNPPKPVWRRPVFQQRQRYHAHRSRTKRRGHKPAIPVHRRNASGGFDEPAELSDLRMIGEQRPVHFDRDNVDQGEGRRENRDDLFDVIVVHSPKKPRMLLRMWPTMKANQTMKQKISVTAVRAESL